MPTFNNAIPQPTDQIKNSQDQILQNFQTLSVSLLGVNNAGLLATNQVSSPATAANQVAIFSRFPLNSGTVPTPTSVMAIRKPSSGAIAEFTDLETNAADGWTRLPSGLLMKWQLVNVPLDSGNVSVSYPFTWNTHTNFPAFSSAPYVFQLAPQFLNAGPASVGTASIFVADSYNATQFNLRVESVSTTFGGWNPFNVFVTAFGPG